MAAPKQVPRGVNDESDWEWLEFDDFTAGIYDYTSIPGSSPNVPGPKGSADPNQTWSCIALPGGGLGPLPGIAEAYEWTGTVNAENYIVGELVHDELANGDTEAFVIWESDNGTNHKWLAYSFICETGALTEIVGTDNATEAGIFGSPYPQFTRVNLVVVDSVTLDDTSFTITVSSADGIFVGDYVSVYSGSPGLFQAGTIVTEIDGTTLTLSSMPVQDGTVDVAFTNTTSPGQPVIAFPNGGPASATDAEAGQLYIYPDPTDPTAYGAFPLIVGSGSDWSSVTGQLVVYQSRIVVLSGITYPYPAGGGFETNEQINYTDPPTGAVLGFQQLTLVTEDPYGYGGWSSVSAGELFLVKKRGGGVLVTGDLNAPNVTFLPGVQPTGNLYGNADSGPAGMFYCSADNGAWLWNGGSTAQKISANLDDNFFLPPEFASMDSNNYGYYVKCIGDKVYFSGNWLFDTRTSSWWRYYPTEAQGGSDLFYINPVSGPSIYVGKLSFTNSGTPYFMFRMDLETPTESYQWQCLPVRLSTKRLVQARRIIVRAANPTNANSQVKVEVYNGSTMVGSVTTPEGDIGTTPNFIPMPIGGVNAGDTPYMSEDITIRVIGIGNGGAAPNIHSVSVAWAKSHQQTTAGVSS